MKKTLTIIVICVMFVSCDHAVYLDFIVQNNCEQSIIVNAEIGYFSGTPLYIIDTVYPYSQKCIYQGVGILGFDKIDIPLILKDMKITQNSEDINYNPLDTAQWQFSHTYDYHYEAILPINPEDFEQ